MTRTRGPFAYKNMAHTMVARIVAVTLGQARKMDNFKACVLGPTGPRHWRKHEGLIQAYFRKLGAQASSSAKTHVGAVHASDLIALRCPGGGVAIDWCLTCCGCDDQVALVVSQLAPEKGALGIGRRPLSQLVWCKQMPCWHGWSIITTVILSTSSPPIITLR